MLARKVDGNWEFWSGQQLAKDGELYSISLEIENSATDEELAGWGLTRVISDPMIQNGDINTPHNLPFDPAVGQIFTGYSFTEQSDGLHYTPQYRMIDDEEFNRWKGTVIASVPGRLDQITQPILQAYPEAERAGWLQKEVEARAYVASQASGYDLTLAPTVTAVCQRQYGDSTEEARKIEVRTMSDVIINKADAFRQIAIGVEGLRITFLSGFQMASNREQLNATIAAFEVALGQLTALISGAQ